MDPKKDGSSRKRKPAQFEHTIFSERHTSMTSPERSQKWRNQLNNKPGPYKAHRAYKNVSNRNDRGAKNEEK